MSNPQHSTHPHSQVATGCGTAPAQPAVGAEDEAQATRSAAAVAGKREAFGVITGPGQL